MIYNLAENPFFGCLWLHYMYSGKKWPEAGPPTTTTAHFSKQQIPQVQIYNIWYCVEWQGTCITGLCCKGLSCQFRNRMVCLQCTWLRHVVHKLISGERIFPSDRRALPQTKHFLTSYGLIWLFFPFFGGRGRVGVIEYVKFQKVPCQGQGGTLYNTYTHVCARPLQNAV